MYAKTAHATYHAKPCFAVSVPFPIQTQPVLLRVGNTHWHTIGKFIACPAEARLGDMHLTKRMMEC